MHFSFTISQDFPQEKTEKCFSIVFFIPAGNTIHVLNAQIKQEVEKMKIWPVAMGVGMAAGAVTAMMLPRQCKARQLVNKAACKVEDTVCQVTDKICHDMAK